MPICFLKGQLCGVSLLSEISQEKRLKIYGGAVFRDVECLISCSPFGVVNPEPLREELWRSSRMAIQRSGSELQDKELTGCCGSKADGWVFSEEQDLQSWLAPGNLLHIRHCEYHRRNFVYTPVSHFLIIDNMCLLLSWPWRWGMYRILCPRGALGLSHLIHFL
jgi:hypothetical protein